MMNVEDAVAAVPLRKDDFVFFVGVHASAPVSVPGCEEGFEIKSPFVLFHGTRPQRSSRSAPRIKDHYLGTDQFYTRWSRWLFNFIHLLATLRENWLLSTCGSPRRRSLWIWSRTGDIPSSFVRTLQHGASGRPQFIATFPFFLAPHLTDLRLEKRPWRTLENISIACFTGKRGDYDEYAALRSRKPTLGGLAVLRGACVH